MAKQVLLVFAGTGDTAANIHARYENEPFNDDVIRIYFNGCHDSAIGGAISGLGYLSPNLDIVAKKIRESFDTDGNLSLPELKRHFGSAIKIEPTEEDELIEINNIALTGFSRGAVTTFAVTRYLNDLDKPIALFAANPVPGDSKQLARKTSSEFYKNHDLRDCHNLRHAEVTLGVYKNNVNPLHNKFFRQMAPLFSEDCDASVYLVPKTHHLHFSRKEKNQEIDFILSQGLRATAGRYRQDRDTMTFVPKIVQQKNHPGTLGRTELLPLYKEELLVSIQNNGHAVSDKSPVKVGQALYALDRAPYFNHKHKLYQIIKNDTSSAGKAIREFIVEFENINQYVFRKNKASDVVTAINQFRGDVYTLLLNLPIPNATEEQKEAFCANILNAVTQLQKIPKKEQAELKQLIAEFLTKENIVLHPELTRYINEQETYQRGTASFKTADSAMLTVKTAKTGDQISDLLYEMSEQSRTQCYHQLPADLTSIITNAGQLGDVLRFLPPIHVKEILNKPEMKLLIKNMTDLNELMEKMFIPEQKKIIFNAMSDSMQALAPDLLELGHYIRHANKTQAKHVLKSLSQWSPNAKSSTDLIDLLEPLSANQIQKLLPVLVKFIPEFLALGKQQDHDHALRTYLQSRMIDDESKKVLNSLFGGDKSLIGIQKGLKSQLSIITADEVTNDTASKIKL